MSNKSIAHNLSSDQYPLHSAFVDILPLSVSVIPWGILCGAIAIETGFSPLQAQLFSLIVFAGAAQLSASTMLGGGAGLATILGSTFAITSQHLLYSFTLRRHIVSMPAKWRVALAFFLTDEMFAVTVNRLNKTGTFDALHALLSGVIFYIFWNLSTFLGIIGGQYFSDIDKLGFDFAIAATFIAMTVPQARNTPIFIAITVSGAVSVLSKFIFHDLHVIVGAASGMLSGFYAQKRGFK